MFEEKKERRYRKRVESDSREDPYASENSDPGVPKALFDARTAAKKKPTAAEIRTLGCPRGEGAPGRRVSGLERSRRLRS